MNNLPLVTVIIPARNESASIVECVEAVRDQDYPLDRIEVIVVDGASSDPTALIAEECLKRVAFAETTVLRNPSGSTPSSLNLGLRRAAGQVVVRVDARSFIQTDYVSTCVRYLQADDITVVVGGTQHAIAGDDTLAARGIARALNNRFSTGFSKYRRQARSGRAETVYLGAFRTDDLRLAGGWNEEFGTNQDFELNRRLSKSGTVWFAAELVTDYRCRSSFSALSRQYVRFGRWKVRYWTQTDDPPRLRQAFALAIAPAAAVGAIKLAKSRPATALATGVVCVAVIDTLGGPRDTKDSITTRLASTLALSNVWASWTAGVWWEGQRWLRDLID